MDNKCNTNCTTRRAGSAVLAFGLLASGAFAATSILDPEFSGSVFDDSVNSIAYLTNNITTDDTITIPQGYTLHGMRFTITGVDPVGSNFKGAVVLNAGTVAHVKNLRVTAVGLANVSGGAGADRLRGILFEACSGTITYCTVTGINKGASGSQEGNGVEIRNAPFDGTHPNTQFVDVSHTTVVGYQKTGVMANGDVDVRLTYNRIGSSATQHHLAANSIQVGFGGKGSVVSNRIDGNQWFGASNAVGTAILLYLSAPGTVVLDNTVRGNSDVGLYILADNVIAHNNWLYDVGEDFGQYDIGIWDSGAGNTITKNETFGFDVPIEY